MQEIFWRRFPSVIHIEFKIYLCIKKFFLNSWKILNSNFLNINLKNPCIVFYNLFFFISIFYNDSENLHSLITFCQLPDYKQLEILFLLFFLIESTIRNEIRMLISHLHTRWKRSSNYDYSRTYLEPLEVPMRIGYNYIITTNGVFIPGA